MKKRSSRRNEFYVYKVARKTDEEIKVVENNDSPQVKEETSTGVNYIISPHFGRQEIKTKYETMGYHRDPSSYDFIRGDKNMRKDIYKKQLFTYHYYKHIQTRP